jgi:hypothetical protein
VISSLRFSLGHPGHIYVEGSSHSHIQEKSRDFLYYLQTLKFDTEYDILLKHFISFKLELTDDKDSFHIRRGRIMRLILTLVFIATQIFLYSQSISAGETTQLPATVIVDASQFIDEIPKDDIIASADSLSVPWLFNNFALVLNSKVNVFANVEIPESGTYHLYVRSQGQSGSFKVAIGDKADKTVFSIGPLSWQQGQTFDLTKGPNVVWLTRINAGPVVDVVVLSKKADLKEEDLRAHQLPKEVMLMKEYQIPRPHTAKFGDVTGDGKSDFMILTSDYSAHVYDHDGKELWTYQAPGEGARRRGGFEAPGAIWDFDRDGHAEVLHWRYDAGREWLVMADGMTGQIKKQVEWPTPPLPHVYNNFRLAIARLHPGYPDNIIVFTDPGNTKSITAYDADLRQLWQHNENKLKDHLGHYPYPVDLNNDGIDEVAVSHLVLDAEGKVLWDRFDLFDDNHDHQDSLRFADINGDGRMEIMAPTSEIGVMVQDALTGGILWQHNAEHAQQLEFGNFLDGVDGPQIAVNARFYGKRGEPGLSAQVHWFDPRGNLVGKWPANPLNGNPDFVKGNWRGDGREELFWHMFKMTGSGRGVLYFPETVYHMFDFTGDGTDEVITIRGGALRVYGSKYAKRSDTVVRHDPDYIRYHITNHTHY